jgi:hypothetical protein
MNAISERVRQGTVEGVQLALSLRTSGDKNSQLAG